MESLALSLSGGHELGRGPQGFSQTGGMKKGFGVGRLARPAGPIQVGAANPGINHLSFGVCSAFQLAQQDRWVFPGPHMSSHMFFVHTDTVKYTCVSLCVYVRLHGGFLLLSTQDSFHVQARYNLQSGPSTCHL